MNLYAPVHIINSAYEEVILWRRNVFRVPSGKAGKEFVQETARLLQSFADATAMERVAMKAVTVFHVLLLQKPAPASTAQLHLRALERRLPLWRAGEVDVLLRECRSIRARLPDRSISTLANDIDAQRDASVFAKLVMLGNVKAAIRYVSEQASKKGVLSISQTLSLPNSEEVVTVGEILKQKHPAASTANFGSVLFGPVADFQPVIFERLDASVVKQAALRSQGAAGPSGVDASGWKRMCCSFGRESTSLCTAVAAVGRRLSCSYVDPSALEAFTACRLIPLDKDPGVRPIGIGEMLRRLVSKSVLAIVREEVSRVCGTMELCAGQSAGAEAAIHAVSDLFNQDDTEAALFVDASNAFNSLNRSATMHNVRILCPSLSIFLINIYRMPSRLFVTNGGEIRSCEGTTQGDPLGMPMYALGLLPLVSFLWDMIRQAWFADDAAAAGKLNALRQWWIRLCEQGPLFGYHPNASKSWLVVKPALLTRAQELFSDLGVQVTSTGRRYLGGAIGTDDFVRSYLSTCITKWVADIERLSSFADSQPHAAFTVFTHGLSSTWTYVQRVIKADSSLFAPLEQVIRHRLLPALTGQNAFGNATRNLLALPARLGGLGIRDPVTTAAHEHRSSCKISEALTDALIAGSPHSQGAEEAAKAAKKVQAAARFCADQNTLSELQKSEANAVFDRRVALLQEKGSSSWITAIPLAEHDLFLHKRAFRDGLALRYGWQIPHLPERCACGESFSLDHAMMCKVGGFPIFRHNLVRDFAAECLREVCIDVECEPALQPLSGETFSHRSARTGDCDRPDVRVRGFWDNRWQDCYLDVRIFHPDCPSYRSSSVKSLFRRFEKEKKRQYGQRTRQVELGSFTPIVLSTYGGMGPEAAMFFRRLACLLAEKKKLEYSMVVRWLRTRLSALLLRSALICLRGTRHRRTGPERRGELSSIEVASHDCHLV